MSRPGPIRFRAPLDPDLPLRLHDLHASLEVGEAVELTIVGADRARTDDAIHGAGFLPVRARASSRTFVVHATRARTLADTVGPDMRLLLCGLNPSVYSADAGAGFARPGNRFWPAALAAGVVTRTHDPRGVLVHDHIGMTDLVKRASPRADQLTKDEFRDGLARIDRLASWLRPGAICFIGLAGWRAASDRNAIAGPQEGRIGGRPVYVMANTSGINAGSTVADHTAHLCAALALAERS